MFYRDVAPGVHRISDSYVNWYLLADGTDLTVVDAGMTHSWGSLQSAVATLGRSLTDVKAVVLTHAHFDHVGIAERARTQLNVPVYAHAAEAAMTRRPLTFDHERSSLWYGWRPATLRVLVSFVAWGMFTTPPVGAVTTFEDDDTLDVPGHPRVVHTPGHTPGHCSLHLPDRDAVVAGDAIVQVDPYTQKPGPRMVCRAATADVAGNRRSLDRLAALGVTTVLTGHGDPITTGVAGAVASARRLPVT